MRRLRKKWRFKHKFGLFSITQYRKGGTHYYPEIKYNKLIGKAKYKF